MVSTLVKLNDGVIVFDILVIHDDILTLGVLINLLCVDDTINDGSFDILTIIGVVFVNVPSVKTKLNVVDPVDTCV